MLSKTPPVELKYLYIKMDKNSPIFALLIISASLLWCASSSAQDDSSLITSLATNPYLLTQSKVEYLKLRKEEEKTPTKELVRKVDDLRYKIQVLNEDRQRLLELLPEEKRAYELMKDVLIKERSIQLFIFY